MIVLSSTSSATDLRAGIKQVLQLQNHIGKISAWVEDMSVARFRLKVISLQSVIQHMYAD